MCRREVQPSLEVDEVWILLLECGGDTILWGSPGGFQLAHAVYIYISYTSSILSPMGCSQQPEEE